MPLSTDELLARLLAGVQRELPDAIALRHRLHAQPELAHAEEQTAAAVAQELPVACATVAHTGRIARVGAAGGAAVAVRAELDGLPMEERTGAPFTPPAVVMHACGHDVHMAALVALTRAAHALGEELPAPLVGDLPTERGGLSLGRRAARPRGAGGDRARGGRRGARPSRAALGQRRARSRRGQRVKRLRRDHRVEGSPRTRPTPTMGAIRSSRSPRSSWPSTPRWDGGSIRSARRC